MKTRSRAKAKKNGESQHPEKHPKKRNRKESSSNEMSPEPIVEEPDDIEFNSVTKTSSNGIAQSGNNAAQELSVLNASGTNDLAAIITAIKAPERPAHIQSSGVSFLDFIPVVNVFNRGVEAGVNCYQNNENRESYNQEVRQYHQTVREVAQNEVDMVEKQCNTIRKIHFKKCETAVEIHKQNCETWLAAKEKGAKNRELKIQKNAELENQRIQQDASIKVIQIQADVQKERELLETELEKHKISECAKVEQHRTEKSTEIAKKKVKLEETKSKNELKLKTLVENNALEGRKMETEERKHERECAMRIEQERIKSNERLQLALAMNSNRRDSANDPGTSSFSRNSSLQYESTYPPAFQSILIICCYNRNDSVLHYRLFEISAESRLRDVANYLLTSDESQSLSNVEIDNSASKLLKIPAYLNAQEFISILCAQERAPLEYFPGVSKLNTIDIPVRNGYCHQINVHFG